MSYFAMNAQEEALKEIARQMAIANSTNLLRELYNAGAISNKDFTEKMQQLQKIT